MSGTSTGMGDTSVGMNRYGGKQVIGKDEGMNRYELVPAAILVWGNIWPGYHEVC